MTSKEEVPPGIRLCAYWSEQYRCLYPGTAVESMEPPHPNDDKFVYVEFDDGDSGRIPLENIRLLTPDYPVVGTSSVSRHAFFSLGRDLPLSELLSLRFYTRYSLHGYYMYGIIVSLFCRVRSKSPSLTEQTTTAEIRLRVG